MRSKLFFTSILIFFSLNQKLCFSQVKPDKFLITPADSAVELTENFFAIQLLPGQTFNGVAYFVPHVGLTANLQILHGNFLQSLSPSTFTSSTCSAYISVIFNYAAPGSTGIYYDTIVDLNHNWLNTVVELTVTNSPTLFRSDSTKTIVSGCLEYSSDIINWNGISLSSPEYCGPIPYVPRDGNGLPLPLNFQYSIYQNQVGWLAFSPPSGIVPFNNSSTVSKIFSGNNNPPNSIWEIRTNNWGAWPRFIRWTKNIVDNQLNLIAPANGIFGVSLMPTLDWNDVPGSSYLVQLATDSNFSTNLIQDTVQVSQLSVQNGILNINNTYYWKVTALRQNCSDIVSGVFRFTTMLTLLNSTSGEIPKEYKLFSNYPNPFNPATTIKFDLPKSSFVRIKIYNSTGREVETIVNEKLSAGSFEVAWNASNFASGIYFYEINAENFKETKKMVLTK